MRLFMLLLVLLMGIVQYHLWFGKNGLQDKYALRKEVEMIERNNAKLKQRNQMMFSEIDSLKSGLEAVEERARNELGLIKEGETFFRIIPKEN
ncbi:MAG: cell division protein FtsB [Psychromonas sp.]|nr:cell division protein FtsB [Psychromonas sp.]